MFCSFSYLPWHSHSLYIITSKLAGVLLLLCVCMFFKIELWKKGKIINRNNSSQYALTVLWNHPKLLYCSSQLASSFGITDALKILLGFVNLKKCAGVTSTKYEWYIKWWHGRHMLILFSPGIFTLFFSQSCKSWANKWTIIQIYSK